MTRQPIHSTAISGVGYNGETMTLEVQFAKSGDVYRYTPVSLETYLAMTDAKHSAGRVFYDSVRGNPGIVATKVDSVELAS